MNTELENYKKSIVKEQEHNEQLTLLLRKIETDINHIKRLIDQCEVKSEALKVDYMTYTRALQETEQALTVVTGVGTEYYYHMQFVCITIYGSVLHTSVIKQTLSLDHIIILMKRVVLIHMYINYTCNVQL